MLNTRVAYTRQACRCSQIPVFSAVSRRAAPPDVSCWVGTDGDGEGDDAGTGVQRGDAESRAHDNMLTQKMCALFVAREPGMALVKPEHTDAETYRHIQETLAWTRGDLIEAERLRDLDPNKHVPPPGTPWEEQMRLTREALDATADEAHDQTKRVAAAVRAARGATA